MSVQDECVVTVLRRPPGPADDARACPSWCALDRAHVVVESAAAAGAVVHRGAESTVTCRGADAPGPVEVRVRRQLSVGYDRAHGAWVADPQPTVHVSGLPASPLHPQDAVDLAIALVTAAAPGPRSAG